MRDVSLIKFNDIFEELIEVVADVDDDVKKAAQTINRTLKDIVCESASNSKYFDLDKFVPLLCKSLKAMNDTIRATLIGWINLLDSISNISLLPYLPLFLEELFLMLGDGDNKETRLAADSCLMEFLKEIKEQERDEESEELDVKIINILVPVC